MKKTILLGAILAVFFMISVPSASAVYCAFTWVPKQPKEGQLVYFMDLSSDEDGDIEHYTWYFDNSETKLTGKNVFYKWESKGEKEVLHIVECSDGDECSKRETLTVIQGKAKEISNPLNILLEMLLEMLPNLRTILLRLLI